MYPEPGPVRAVDQRITRYSFSPMRLKIHSAVRVWFAISRQVTRDTLVPGVHRLECPRASPPHIEPKTMVMRAARPDSDRGGVEGNVLTCLRLDIQRA
jgi:hypothetical protein